MHAFWTSVYIDILDKATQVHWESNGIYFDFCLVLYVLGIMEVLSGLFYGPQKVVGNCGNVQMTDLSQESEESGKFCIGEMDY